MPRSSVCAPVGPERLAQNRDAVLRLRVAAHENVQRGIIVFGPRVDRNVAFGQHGDPGDAEILVEMMQVDVQQRRTVNRQKQALGQMVANVVLDEIRIVLQLADFRGQPIHLFRITLTESRKGFPCSLDAYRNPLHMRLQRTEGRSAKQFRNGDH